MPQCAGLRVSHSGATMAKDEVGAVSDRPWFFGLMRDAGSYRIVAAGEREAQVRREMAHIEVPTMVVTAEDLPDLGIGDAERQRWLPEAVAARAATRKTA